MADTPVWSGELPVLFSGAYQKRQFRTDAPGAVADGVFDALAHPPELPTESS